MYVDFRLSPEIKEEVDMALIGYMEGTNPDLLSTLCAQGHETLPLGNGADGHGKYIAHLTAADGVSAVIAYLHKLTPVSGMEHISIDDRLFACRMHDIPVLLVVPEEFKSQAREKLEKETQEYVDLVSPGELQDEVLKVVE
ncbi:MAG: hypothetical protein ACLFO3_00665 [Candidatus Acetothermia bacterium]